jgi:hypothetical protein
MKLFSHKTILKVVICNPIKPIYELPYQFMASLDWRDKNDEDDGRIL